MFKTVAAVVAVAVMQAATPLTLERVAQLEQGLDLKAVLQSRAASYVHILPDPFPPLDRFHRSYWMQDVEGRPFIMAEYVLGGGRQPGVRIGRPVSGTDGGCRTIIVIFNPDTGRPVGASCNGVA